MTSLGWLGVEGIDFLLGGLADGGLGAMGGLVGGLVGAFASLAGRIYENITCSERVSFHHARV